MKRKDNKRGISLIVLVITIIIIIILAGAVMLSLNNSGIISKAKIATTKQEINTITEALQAYDLNNMSDTVDFTDPVVWSKREYSLSYMSVELRSAIKADIGNDFTGHKFYVLDMAKLVAQGVIPAANNGYAKKGPNDIYIIDSVTGNIYYVATPTPLGGSSVISETNPNENVVPTVTQIVGMPAGETVNSYYGTNNGTYITTDLSEGGSGGFYSLNTNTNALECITRNFDSWVSPIYTFKSGMYFADGRGNLFKLVGTTLTAVTGISYFHPYDNYPNELSNGEIYISGYGSPYRLDGTTATVITGMDSITDYSSIYENKVTGDKYITLVNGVYRLNGSVATKICDVSGAYSIGLYFDGYGNTYCIANTDSGNLIYKLENDTLVEVTGWSGSINGGIYKKNKELYLRCSYDVFKISDKTATRVSLPAGFVNDVIYDSYNDKLYILVVNSGLYYVQETTGTKLEGYTYTSSAGVYNNQRLGKTYVKNDSKLYLLDGLNTTQVTGMLGTASSYPSIYFNNYNGKMYAYDRKASDYSYYYYSITGTSATSLTGFGNTYGSFYINSYNGEVFFIQNSTLYKLVGNQLTQVPGVSSISGMNINEYNGNVVLFNSQGIYRFTY